MQSHEDQVKNKYFEWLYNYVCKGRTNSRVSYRKLFMALHDTTFDFYIRNDMNRAIDGTDLRYRFAAVMGDESIANILDDPCTVLEMILALSIRCEETIMDDPAYGDRTSQWFWNMMSNLGLSMMTDEKFNRDYVNKVIYNFLERNYDPDGKGGLFYIRNVKADLRNIEIWTQLCWYLDNFA